MLSLGRTSFRARAFVVAMASSGFVHAAPAWVDRAITLPRHDWAFDVGLGIGHTGTPSDTGLGMNLELAVGLTRHLELGLRTGLRFGDDGRNTRADDYGRLFDRQTFGTWRDSAANPEFRLRGGLVEGDVGELALEGRVTLPFETNSRVMALLGMPLHFHLGRSVRLDTGPYVPVTFVDPTAFAVSVPLDVWIQTSRQLWLGPMTGVRFYHQGNVERTDISFGFGLGYSITHYFDLKTMALFPGINHTEGARNFGLGVGIEVRIE